ncbi:unnamed protein product [Plutella xylostella]|uniref:long-chain-fatty-acid--CoA ligase n=1 Tax=Plutella xylostella TaxID=51655 RepID=A0A8S4G1Y9_PLUXY|nr:unnamed protein product [Plutella xylostella]
MDTTPEEAAQVVALLQQGLSQRAVAAQLHLSQSAVSRVYRRFQETGAFNRRPRTGRHRCTSERDDRFIVSTSLRNRHLTGVDVQQELRRVRQVAVSEWTVRRRLKEANLTPKRPASGPKLTAGHRQARLQFAREHLDWSIAQWRSVLFTDECRVCLHGSDRRGRVYRRPGERFAQCCFAETVAYGGGSCMMWAGISLEGKTALVFVPGGGRGGGLTADRYITDILLGHVVPYAEFVGEDFVLMHDNARCHTARVSRQFLREKELRTMDWPALSPDLNPIEHLWDELKRRVRARNPVPASVDELKTALLEEWDGIPQETVKKLIRSMRNRLQAIFAKISSLLGGNIRLMISGGAPLSPDTHTQIRICLSCDVIAGYGLTETTSAATVMDAHDRSTGRVGAPTTGTDIKLVNWEEGNYRVTNKPFPQGEVVIGGDSVAEGYYKNPEKTREEFLEADGRRWFRSGDIAELHHDGCLKIIDRKKDLVKLQAGEYVSLGKVEAELKTCPVVENICVYGDSSKNHTVALLVPNPQVGRGGQLVGGQGCPTRTDQGCPSGREAGVLNQQGAGAPTCRDQDPNSRPLVFNV